MLKKYALIGFLVVTAALSLSAFRPLAYIPAPIFLVNPVDPTFRFGYLWNGINIPSLNLSTAPVIWRQYEYRTDSPASSHPVIWRQYEYRPNSIVTGFQTPPMSDFVPSIAVTGFRTPPMSDFVPSKTATGLSDTRGKTNFIRPVSTPASQKTCGYTRCVIQLIEPAFFSPTDRLAEKQHLP